MITDDLCEVQNALDNNEFSRMTLHAIRDFLYVQYRDWDRLSYDPSQPPFVNEQAGIGWRALSRILGTIAPPEHDDEEAIVKVGSAALPMASVSRLEKAIQANLSQGART